MKSMLENNIFVWNSETQTNTTWPHFTNQERMKKDEGLFRKLCLQRKVLIIYHLLGNNKIQSPASPKNVSNETKPNVDTTEEKKTSVHLNNNFQIIDNRFLLKPPKMAFKKDTCKTIFK